MNFATRFTEFKTQKGKNELDVKKASPDNDSSVEENLKKNDAISVSSIMKSRLK